MKRLRREGAIPGIVYGRSVQPQSIAMRLSDFRPVFHDAGETTLIDLAVDGSTPMQVLIQDVAMDPLSDEPIHVDFRHVAMDEEITARIPLQFVGIAPAVKDAGGVLVKQYDHVEVRALPNNLVHEITVDLSVLKTLDDAIHMRDLVMPTGVTITADPNIIVAKVTEVRVVAEEQPAATAPAIAADATPVAGATAPAAAKEEHKGGEKGSAKK